MAVSTGEPTTSAQKDLAGAPRTQELRKDGSTERAPARKCSLGQEIDPNNGGPERMRLWGGRHPDSLSLSSRYFL